MKFKTFVLALIVAIFTIGFVSSDAKAEDSQKLYGAIVYNLGQKQVKPGTGDSDTDLFMQDVYVNKIGVTGSKGDVKYKFEFGFFNSDNPAGSNKVFTRLAYVDVKAGPGNLMFGQNYEPYTMLSSCLIGYPVFASSKLATGYGARKPQVKYSVMGLYIDFITPSQSDPTGASSYDTTLPKIAVGYDGGAGPLKFGVGFGYQSYKVDDAASTFDGESLAAWAGYAHAKGKFGAISFKFNFIYANNPTRFGLAPFGADGSAELNAAGDAIEDTTGMGFMFDLGYNFGIGALNLGIAYEKTDNGEWDNSDTSMTYYVQAKIGLAKGVAVVPGLLVQDAQKDAADATETKTTYYGLAFVGSF